MNKNSPEPPFYIFPHTLIHFLVNLLTFYLASSDIMSGTLSSMSSDMFSGISSDILSGISRDILSGTSFDILSSNVCG